MEKLPSPLYSEPFHSIKSDDHYEPEGDSNICADGVLRIFFSSIDTYGVFSAGLNIEVRIRAQRSSRFKPTGRFNLKFAFLSNILSTLHSSDGTSAAGLSATGA